MKKLASEGTCTYQFVFDCRGARYIDTPGVRSMHDSSSLIFLLTHTHRHRRILRPCFSIQNYVHGQCLPFPVIGCRYSSPREASEKPETSRPFLSLLFQSSSTQQYEDVNTSNKPTRRSPETVHDHHGSVIAAMRRCGIRAELNLNAKERTEKD